MAQGILFVGWGAIIPGREQKASMVLGEAMQYLERLKAEGTIDDVSSNERVIEVYLGR